MPVRMRHDWSVEDDLSQGDSSDLVARHVLPSIKVVPIVRDRPYLALYTAGPGAPNGSSVLVDRNGNSQACRCCCPEQASREAGIWNEADGGVG